MEHEAEKRLYRLYMAQVGEAVASGMGYKVVPFAQIIGKNHTDDRTGDEIADDLIDRMMNG